MHPKSCHGHPGRCQHLPKPERKPPRPRAARRAATTQAPAPGTHARAIPGRLLIIQQARATRWSRTAKPLPATGRPHRRAHGSRLRHVAAPRSSSRQMLSPSCSIARRGGRIDPVPELFPRHASAPGQASPPQRTPDGLAPPHRRRRVSVYPAAEEQALWTRAPGATAQGPCSSRDTARSRAQRLGAAPRSAVRGGVLAQPRNRSRPAAAATSRALARAGHLARPAPTSRCPPLAGRGQEPAPRHQRQRWAPPAARQAPPPARQPPGAAHRPVLPVAPVPRSGGEPTRPGRSGTGRNCPGGSCRGLAAAGERRGQRLAGGRLAGVLDSQPGRP